MIDLADIELARDRIAGKVRRTPVLPLTQLREGIAPDLRVTLKLECLQVAGSFKARGAMNRLLSTPRAEVDRGIVTASGGNHGVAVARTAFVAGVPAVVFVPAGVSAEKVANMRAWKADVRVVGNEWAEANAAALGFARDEGATFFHAFADPAVVAGQGTLGLEILDDIPDLEAIVVAIGGGGLISGISTALRARKPTARIIGVEPVGSPTLKASLDAGRVVSLPEITTRVQTMACRRTEPAVFEMVRRNVDEIVLVTDEEMLDASRWLWRELGVAADLSGAASAAVLRKQAFDPAGHICALICGVGSEGTQ